MIYRHLTLLAAWFGHYLNKFRDGEKGNRRGTLPCGGAIRRICWVLPLLYFWSGLCEAAPWGGIVENGGIYSAYQIKDVRNSGPDVFWEQREVVIDANGIAIGFYKWESASWMQWWTQSAEIASSMAELLRSCEGKLITSYYGEESDDAWLLVGGRLIEKKIFPQQAGTIPKGIGIIGMNEEYKSYNVSYVNKMIQGEDPGNGEYLGYSMTASIGGSGCVLASAAMMLGLPGGKLKEFNDELKAQGEKRMFKAGTASLIVESLSGYGSPLGNGRYKIKTYADKRRGFDGVVFNKELNPFTDAMEFIPGGGAYLQSIVTWGDGLKRAEKTFGKR